jgi:molecular chaperone DnaK
MVDARNQADAMAHQTEKSLNELGEKVDGATRADLEAKINDVRDATKTDDVDRIKRAMETLQQASMKLGEAMYAEQPGAAPVGDSDGGSDQATSTDQSGPEEDVVEGEFTEA